MSREIPDWKDAALGQEFGPFRVVGQTMNFRGAYNRGPSRSHYYLDWVCQICGYYISASGLFNPLPGMREHEERGHTACERCGVMLKNCKDGSPRRHNWRLCAGKDESYHVVSVYDRDRVGAAA